MIHIVKFLLWMLSRFPAGMPWWLSGKLAGFWSRISPTKRHVAERNLERCYPEMDADERARIVHESFRHYLCTVLESGRNWYWSAERLRSLCDGIVNEHLLLGGLATGRGVLVLAPHFGAWEYLGIYLQKFEEIAILYKPPAHQGLNDALLAKRSRDGANMIPATASGLRHLYAHIRAGKGAGVLPDQQPKRGKGQFAPFFGIPALTGVLVPRLVQRTNCVVYACVCERISGGRYQVHALPVDDSIHSDDLVTSLTAMNKAVEDSIAVNVPQFLWSYRRFRARPEGEPRFYSD